MKETMKISHVILRLQELQEKHGDLEVWCAEPFGGAMGPIFKGEISKSIDHYESADDGRRFCPERICIYLI